MNKLKLFLAISLFAPLLGLGQTTDWDDMIKLRSRLKTSVEVQARDLIKAQVDSAVTISNRSTFFALYPIELWLSYYVTNQWSNIMTSVAAYDSTYARELTKKTQPLKDELYQSIKKSGLVNKQNIIQAIESSSLSQEEKEFVLLHFSSCLQGIGDSEITQDSLNTLANVFLSKWPDNKWQWYIKTYIRSEYVAGKWGIDFDIFTGFGEISIDKQQKFDNLIPMGFGFSVFYRRAFLQFRNYLGRTRVKEAIPMQTTTWERASYVSMYKLEGVVGASVLETRLIRVLPFAGISTFDLFPTEDEIGRNENYKTINYEFFPMVVLGSSIDLKIARKPRKIMAGCEQNYWFLRCRFAYESYKLTESNTCNAYTLTMSLGGFARKISKQ